MSLYESVRAITESSGDGPIDWSAVTEATRSIVDPGSVDLTRAQREGYATDVSVARDRVAKAAGVGFDLPDSIEIQNRHHWIDANVSTFERVMAPFEDQDLGVLPGLVRTINTGSMTVALSFLSNNVLGQYDPLLLAEGEDHALYFVHPNIERVAEELDVDSSRFRRWIAFHEVTHAAEFGAAPWLSDHLEDSMRRGVDELSEGKINFDTFRELNAAMTVVEGYAELLMDEAFDEEYADLREKIDARRGGQGPISKLVRRVLGLGMKRRQYERGKAFFEAVVEARGLDAASAVWDSPETLPTGEELDDPPLWLARVGP